MEFGLEDHMNSTVKAKYQTTIPKAVREILGISVNDALEWIVEKGQVVVQPISSQPGRVVWRSTGEKIHH